MRLPLWPQSLFGRLLAASVIAVLLAQTVGLFLIAQEREHFVLQGSVREWVRRIVETTLMLQALTPAERAEAVSELAAPRDGQSARVTRPLPEAARRGLPPPERVFLRLPLLPGFENTLREHLHATLGPEYTVDVSPTPAPPPPAVPVPVPFYEAHELAAHLEDALRYDVTVRFPDADTVVYRVTRMAGGAPLPRNLLINLILLVLILVVVLYLVARSITRPLSELAAAADRVGRQSGVARLTERGARELRDAARAFNTMQDRLRRYLDSRTRVLAAMSHDLKTPLTRLRLQVEALDNPPMQERIGHELDEMEGMVRDALSLFRGLDDGEPAGRGRHRRPAREGTRGIRRHGRGHGQRPGKPALHRQGADAQALSHEPDRERHQVRGPRGRHDRGRRAAGHPRARRRARASRRRSSSGCLNPSTASSPRATATVAAPASASPLPATSPRRTGAR